MERFDVFLSFGTFFSQKILGASRVWLSTISRTKATRDQDDSYELQEWLDIFYFEATGVEGALSWLVGYGCRYINIAKLPNELPPRVWCTFVYAQDLRGVKSRGRQLGKGWHYLRLL